MGDDRSPEEVLTNLRSIMSERVSGALKSEPDRPVSVLLIAGAMGAAKDNGIDVVAAAKVVVDAVVEAVAQAGADVIGGARKAVEGVVTGAIHEGAAPAATARVAVEAAIDRAKQLGQDAGAVARGAVEQAIKSAKEGVEVGRISSDAADAVEVGLADLVEES